MKRALISLFALVFACGLMVAQQQPPVAATHLKVGDMAPDFTLPDHNGQQVKLSDFRGKKNVILAFYVLAFTGGWTKELQGYQDGIANGKIDTNDTEVFGISIDAPPSNAEFAKKIGVTSFRLLSDMTRQVSKDYGILNEQRQFARRTTFVVDKEGKIQHIEAGSSAIDPTNAAEVCLTLKKKEASKD